MAARNDIDVHLNVDANIDEARKTIGKLETQPLKIPIALGGGQGWANVPLGTGNALGALNLGQQKGTSGKGIPQETIDTLEKLNKHFVDLNEELETQRKTLQLQRALLTPTVVQEQARLEVEKLRLGKQILEIDKQRAKALEAAKRDLETADERKSRVHGEVGSELGGWLSGDRNKKALGLIQKATGAEEGKDRGGSGLGQAGSMIGEMVGGPIGAAVGQYIGEKIPEIIAAPAKLATKGLDMVAGGLRSLQSNLGPLSVGLDAFSGGIGMAGDVLKGIPLVGEALGPLVDTLAAVPNTIKSIMESIVSLGGVASPAAIKQFTLAVTDAQGIVGQALVPALHMMREAVRWAGDVIAAFIPNATEMYSALSEVRQAFNEYGAVLKEFYQIVGPFVREYLLFGIRNVGSAISIMLGAVKEFYQYINLTFGPGLRQLGKWLGIDMTPRTAVGAAAREVTHTSFESYQKQLQASAYGQPGQITMAEMPKTVFSIEGILKRIMQSIENPPIAEFADALAKALGEKISQTILGNPATQAVEQGTEGANKFTNIYRNINKIKDLNFFS